jgi:hypothetical protein
MSWFLFLYLVGIMAMTARLVLDFLVEPIRLSPTDVAALFVIVLLWPVSAPVTIYLARQWRRDMRKGEERT